MAKRRSRAGIDADKIIKAKLNLLGEKIWEQSTARSRVDTGQLRNSQNYRVKPDTTLTVAQVFYGKYQKPNELEVAIDTHKDDTTTIIVQEITDQILEPFKKKR